MSAPDGPREIEFFPTLNGGALKDLRKERGLSLNQLADASGGAFTQTQVLRSERGDFDDMKVRTLLAYAAIYGLTIAEMISTVYGIDPESKVLQLDPAALEIGRKVMSIDPSLRQPLIEYIEKLTAIDQPPNQNQ